MSLGIDAESVLGGSDSEDSEKRDSLRIAMISTHGYVAADPPLGAPDTGGQVVYVLELSKVLARLGYKVDIFTRLFEDQPPFETVTEGVNLVRIPCGGKEFIPKEYLADFIPEWVDGAEAWIKSQHHTYKFINSHYWDAGLAGCLLAERLLIPHIHTPHSLGIWKKKNMEVDYSESPESFEAKYNFINRIKTEQRIYETCNGIVATTPIQQEILISDYHVNEEHMAMIPPGYDDNKFYPVGEASKAMIKDKIGFPAKSILTLSRLANNKGLDLLIDGFSLLAKRFTEAHLFLAVGHEERSEAEEVIYQELLTQTEKYDLKSHIHFIGFIPDEQLADYYRASDIFVLPSRYEPFGMAAVEAMACGTPTIVTAHGGLCKIIIDGVHALKADPFDPEELAMDMATIFRHEGLAQKLSSAGSSMVREKFSWTEIANQLVELVDTKGINEQKQLSPTK